MICSGQTLPGFILQTPSRGYAILDFYLVWWVFFKTNCKLVFTNQQLILTEIYFPPHPQQKKWWWLFCWQFDVTKAQNAIEGIRQFIREEIRKHRETYDENNIRDLVDLYLQAEKNGFKDHKGLDGNLLETCIKYMYWYPL